jgi:predicted SAM-dependent methyltransferase
MSSCKAVEPHIKLHLGCGNKILDGWINVDIASDCPDVVIDDAATLKTITDNSASIIYACHILEHLGRQNTLDTLRIWYNKLKPGGVVRISVPDMSAVFKKYQEGIPLSLLLGFLYGGQRNEHDFHKIAFDYNFLKEMLESAGFKDVKSFDWKQTEHSHIDDYSQAYLPHMDKEGGMLMSLNMEAMK